MCVGEAVGSQGRAGCWFVLSWHIWCWWGWRSQVLNFLSGLGQLQESFWGQVEIDFWYFHIQKGSAPCFLPYQSNLSVWGWLYWNFYWFKKHNYFNSEICKIHWLKQSFSYIAFKQIIGFFVRLWRQFIEQNLSLPAAWFASFRLKTHKWCCFFLFVCFFPSPAFQDQEIWRGRALWQILWGPLRMIQTIFQVNRIQEDEHALQVSFYQAWSTAVLAVLTASALPSQFQLLNSVWTSYKHF